MKLKGVKMREKSFLMEKATKIRKHIVEMICKAKSGHPGGSLSAADIVTALYFSEMNIDPKNPKMDNRDRFVLSKGHAAPVLYAALAERGYFDKELLGTLREFGSPLQGHPDMKKCPGIDISTGSLGQGLSCAVGMAIAGKRDNKNYRVFAMLGDGECDEGQIWEAVMAGYKYQLNNLIVFVDNNKLQLDGTCDEIMPNIDLGKRFEAFGYEVFYIDGHNMEEIVATLDKIRASHNNLPKAIIADTIKGRGVSFMENQLGWHGVAPNDEEYKQAMEELDGGLK